MRCALCLHGLVGGRLGNSGKGKTVDYVRCFESLKKYIIDENNCDVFIHSWSKKQAKRLNVLYHPKSSIYEKQIDFRKVKRRTGSPKHFRAASRWYSAQQSIRLKQEYEKEYEFEYDWVMLTRFDILFFKRIKFSKLDPKLFHAPIYNQCIFLENNKYVFRPTKKNRSETEEELADLFFLANSENMDTFGDLFDSYEKYHPRPHKAAWQHINRTIGDPKKIMKYLLYRWWDYELFRFKAAKNPASVTK